MFAALAARRRARRPLRAALVHGRRPAARRRPASCSCCALDADADYLADVLPALLLYSLGLALTVVAADRDGARRRRRADAGIASAVNNAIARTAGLLATAAVGAVLARPVRPTARRLAARTLPLGAAAGRRRARDRALEPGRTAGLPPGTGRSCARPCRPASTRSTSPSMIGAAMLPPPALGGVFLRNPRRRTAAAAAPAGPLVGAPEEVGGRPRRRSPPAAQGLGRRRRPSAAGDGGGGQRAGDVQRLGAAQGAASTNAPSSAAIMAIASSRARRRGDAGVHEALGGGGDPALEHVGAGLAQRLAGAGDLERHGRDRAGVGVVGLAQVSAAPAKKSRTAVTRSGAGSKIAGISAPYIAPDERIASAPSCSLPPGKKW